MPNKIFRDKLISRINDAITQSKEAASLEHSGIVGRVRELVVNSLVRPLLTRDFEVGTGKITDSLGTQSGQIDVIIYSPRLLMPLMYDKSLGVFPLESCFRAIEVKSTLTAAALKKAIGSARQVAKEFKYLPGEYDGNGRTVSHGGKKVGRMLFAFGTDLSVKDELSRYKDLDPEWSTTPAIRAFCIVNSGFWVPDPAGKWQHIPPTPEHDEVIEFFLACVRELPADLRSRREPRLDGYISRHVAIGSANKPPKKV